MSTRCNVIVNDGFGDQIIFYRHSDGYPSGVAKTLGEFLLFVKTGKLRDNAEQSAGWLIILGHEEYASYSSLDALRGKAKSEHSSMEWKAGAYEPCLSVHGDIEYFYEVDLKAKTLKGWEHDGEKKGKCVTRELKAELAKLGY